MNSKPFPRRELISQAVLARLEGVGVAAGDNVTFKVRRYLRNPEPPQDLELVIHELPARKADETSLQHYTWWAPYELQIYVFEPEQLPGAMPFDQRCNIALADAEAAVTKDGTFGQLAMRTELLDPVGFEETGDVGGMICRFQCLYRTLIKNPYS